MPWPSLHHLLEGYELRRIADDAHRDDAAASCLDVDGSEHGVPGARKRCQDGGLAVQGDDAARARDRHPPGEVFEAPEECARAERRPRRHPDDTAAVDDAPDVIREERGE